MAKKKSSAEFNMSEEFRTLLRGSPELTGKEALEALKAKYPNARINENSAGVAYSSARKKLGLAPAKRRRGKRGGARKVVRRRLPSAVKPSVGLATLQAAAKLLAEAGNSETAIEAIKQVQGLQLK